MSDPEEFGSVMKREKEFLSLDLFDPYSEKEDLSTLIRKYKDPSDGLCYAKSKWLFPDGAEPDFRPCTVLKFDQESGLFLVKWTNHKS